MKREVVRLALELAVSCWTERVLRRYKADNGYGLGDLLSACGDENYVKNLIMYNTVPGMTDEDFDRAAEMALQVFDRKPGQEVELDREERRLRHEGE